MDQGVLGGVVVEVLGDGQSPLEVGWGVVALGHGALRESLA